MIKLTQGNGVEIAIHLDDVKEMETIGKVTGLTMYKHLKMYKHSDGILMVKETIDEILELENERLK